jgi:hypothetical protein
VHFSFYIFFVIIKNLKRNRLKNGFNFRDAPIPIPVCGLGIDLEKINLSNFVQN